MIVDTRLVRQIGRMANQVKFGMQSNRTLFPLAMSPTNLGFKAAFVAEDYEKKASIRKAHIYFEGLI